MLPFLLSALVTLSPPEPSTAPSEVVEIVAPEPPPPALSPPAPTAVEAPQPADPAPRETKAEPKAADEQDETAAKKPKKYDVDVEARIIAGGRLVHTEAVRDAEGNPIGDEERKGALVLRQARVGIDARYKDILRARVTLDFADLLGTPTAGDVLRNAFADIKIHDAFQIRVGHFKRPYSRLELRSTNTRPFLGRGLYNGLAIEDLQWGDRAVGMAIRGKLEPGRAGLERVSWMVSITNNAITGAPNGFDVHARLVYDPLPWLSIGANWAYKNVQDPLANETQCRTTWKRGPECRRNVYGAGGDVAFEVGGFDAMVEVNLAQDWLNAEGSPWLLGALGYASYEISITEKTRLQPVLFGEYIDTNLSYAESEALRGGGAFNVLWGKRLRVIPQVEFVAPLRPITSFNRFVGRQVYGLWIAVQL
jgi:hypothetical protein